MQPNELKALMTKTDEVAFHAYHVEVEVSNRRNKRGQIHCPTGLVRGKVLQNGVKWTEHRLIAVCGDQEYNIERKNGVLVEIDPDDLPENWGVIVGKNVFNKHNGKRSEKPYPHTAVIIREGKKYIHMITSRKAIFSSWGEYSLEMAKREKANQDEIDKDNALKIPQATIMGFTPEAFDDMHVHNHHKDAQKFVYLGREWITTKVKKDSKGETIWKLDNYGYSRTVPEEEVGRIEITLDRANEILSILTPAQKKKLGIPKS